MRHDTTGDRFVIKLEGNSATVALPENISSAAPNAFEALAGNDRSARNCRTRS
jgi:hypothetical protein